MQYPTTTLGAIETGVSNPFLHHFLLARFRRLFFYPRPRVHEPPLPPLLRYYIIHPPAMTRSPTRSPEISKALADGRPSLHTTIDPYFSFPSWVTLVFSQHPILELNLNVYNKYIIYGVHHQRFFSNICILYPKHPQVSRATLQFWVKLDCTY